MGIPDLTPFLKTILLSLPAERRTQMVKPFLSFSDLPSKSKLFIDASIIFFRCSVMGPPSVEGMNSGCVKGFCQILRAARDAKMEVEVVFDQPEEGVNALINVAAAIPNALSIYVQEAPTWALGSGLDAATIIQAKTNTRNKRVETRKATEERSGKPQFSTSMGLVRVIKRICDLLRIPTHFPLVEADWVLSSLAKRSSAERPTYILTDDSDLIAADVGDAWICRTHSLCDYGRMRGGQYEVVSPRLIWEEVGLTYPSYRAMFSTVLSNDYFQGVHLIGPASVMNLFYVMAEGGRGAKKRLRWAEVIHRVRYMLSREPEGTLFDYEGRSIAEKQLLISALDGWFLHPTCFNGLTSAQLSDLVGVPGTKKWLVPLTAVYTFLISTYKYRVTDTSSFRTALLALMYGPIIECVDIDARASRASPLLSAPTQTGGGSGEKKDGPVETLRREIEALLGANSIGPLSELCELIPEYAASDLDSDLGLDLGFDLSPSSTSDPSAPPEKGEESPK